MFGTGATSRVAAQWTYDAYGAVLSADHLYPHAYLHCGHKGLFFDRSDGGVGVGGGGVNLEPPRLIPFAHYVYQIRNRAYSPGLGRFFQRDPNATAMTLLAATAHHGRGAGAISIAFDMESMYGDGMNLYEYLGSNPWQRRDPLGLSWDPFDIVDDYLAESSGAVAALLSQLGQNAHAAAVLTATIASYLPFPIVGSLGDMALYALGEQSGEALAVGVMIGMVPGGKLAGFIGRMASSAFSTALSYAKKHGSGIMRRFTNGVQSLAERAGLIVRGCGCFTAGTQVWTEGGLVPIEEIKLGDLVWARDEATGEMSLRCVLRTFSRPGAPIVAVTLIGTAEGTTTLRTTEEHPFFVDGRGWIAAQDLAPGDVVQLGRVEDAKAAVELVEFTSERSRVYNFEVEGLHNYLVGEDGTLVHNSNLLPCVPHGIAAPFKEADRSARAARAAGFEVEAHHLVEQRHFKRGTFRGSSDDFMGVVLTKDEHGIVTNALRDRLPYGTTYDITTIGNAYRDVYTTLGHADWWNAIEGYFK